MDLVESINEENAGRYAGLIASAFMVGRATTSLVWGRIADTYGRVLVLHASLLLSCIFSLLFGVAPTLSIAIIIRFLMGCSNGIMSALKTIVSELAHNGDEKSEARNMSLVIGMWGLGFLICPAVSGLLAEPLKQYPGAKWIQEDGTIVHWIMEQFPFLLPNLLGALICILSISMLALFVPETLQEELRRHPRHMMGDFLRQVRAWIPGNHRHRVQYRSIPVLKQHASDLDWSERSVTTVPETETENEQSNPITMTSLWAKKDTRLCLLVYWGYSFVGITVDEAFPLFCMSIQTGFGLSELAIGKILSFCGFVFVLTQYKAYSFIYDRFGLVGAVRAGSFLSAPTVLLTPIALLLNRGSELGVLNTGAFFYLGSILAFHRVFSLAFFTSISVLMNRSVPASQRATMNGLSQIGGSIAKGLGPAFAGLLVSQSVAFFGKVAPLFIFGTISVLGIIVALATFIVLHEDSSSLSISSSSQEEDGNLELSKIEERQAPSKH